MYLKIFINIFFLIILSIIHLAFINGLSGWMSELNIVVITLIFILGLCDFKIWLWWAFGFGLIFDLYSFTPFGLNAIIFPVLVIIVNFFLTNYLTNRSLYSFIIGTFLFTLFYDLLFFIFEVIIYFFKAGESVFSHSLLYNFLSGVIVNVVAVILVFNILNIFTKVLKPVFLGSGLKRY